VSAALAACAAGLLVLPAGAAAAPTPFGKLTCVPQEGVRFCPGDGAAKRVNANGVPLDADVALPATGDTNLPLVVILHGYGGKKGGFGEMKPWAERGYAVLDYSARGFGASCGSSASRLADPIGCAQGWVRLADTRYEVRDTQNLAGLLADEGLVDPQRIGATGTSYGGGQSMALATLKDRVMNPDGSLGPWRSPGGKPMRIAAAAPNIPWTDLVYSLLPNGRTLDYVVQPTSGPGSSRAPIGVAKQTYIAGLFASGQASGYYSPPGTDPDADLTTWFARINSGEPYDPDPLVRDIANEIAEHHTSYHIPGNQPPAPLLISNGWTDDLFPADEALRYYNRTRALYPGTPIALRFFDYGHSRGANKAADVAKRTAAVFAWFDFHVRGIGARPADDVTVLTQTCPKTTPSAGPFSASTWDAIHPGEVRQVFAAAKTLTSGGGDPSVNQKVDPIGGGGDACASTPSSDLSGVATYRFAPSPGYTLLGSPTVIGKFAVTGANAQIAARLWDVAPGGGAQTLVARALYRPTGSGTEVFQLHANGWQFAPGHVAKLELLGNDAPYGRASNGAFQISASDVDVRLPVRDAPGAFNGVVGSPAAVVLPAGQRLAPGIVRLRVGLRYTRPFLRRLRSGRRVRAACWSSVRAGVTGQGLGEVRRIDFFLGRRRVAVDSRRPFSVPIWRSATIRHRSRVLTVRTTLRSGRRIFVRRTLVRCPAPRATRR